MGDASMNRLSDAGSIPARSTMKYLIDLMRLKHIKKLAFILKPRDGRQHFVNEIKLFNFH